MPKKPDTLVLPDFELLRKQPDLPHTKRVLATCTLPNGTEVIVASDRPGRRFAVWARHSGFRASNTLSTGKRDKAEAWVRAVKACRVTIAEAPAPSWEDVRAKLEAKRRARGD